ncbi:MAG: TRAP transporter substrate-binding protein DctP, partial [Tistlia sp.]
VMRVSHQLPPAHHIAQLVDQWAADVERLSEGTLAVEVLGANTAFKPDQNFPAVARGQIEAAISVNFQWGNTIPEMNVVTLPYFMTDIERVKRFPGSDAAQLLEEKLLGKGVRNVAWLFTTNSSIFTSAKKPIVEVADFQGLKIRGLNKLVDEAFAANGAAPTAMPGSEVYQGLQTGVIDAGLTDVSAAYSRKYYEVQSYGTVTPFFTVYFHIFVNPAWFDGLTEAQRTAITEASAKAEEASYALTAETASAAIEQLQAKGMTLHIQSEAETEAWKQAMQPPVMEAFKASSDDAARIVELVDKL